jgi:chaperonin GroEL (HSP60 family)
MNNEGKPKTPHIVKRTVNVYLPTYEMRIKWKDLAKKTGTSLSKFIIEHVENSIQQEKDENKFNTRLELLKQLKNIKQENKNLRKQNKMMDTVIERLESELHKKRIEPFIETEFKGTRTYSNELINLLREKKEIRKEELLDLLNIESTDLEIIKGLHQQIHDLEEYGIITDRGVTWKWTP